MTQDKKKLLVIGILFLALVAVGTYQFVGSSSPAPQKSNTSKAKAADNSGTPLQPDVEETPSGLHAFGLTPRNPFQPGTLPSESKVDEPENNRIVQAPPEKPSPRVPTPYKGDKPPWDPTIPGVSLQPGGEAPAPANEFTYTLIGLVDGPTPVAVFLTGDGVQKMVRVGEYVGQNAKVVRIQNGSVTIQADGKTITQRVGGN